MRVLVHMMSLPVGNKVDYGSEDTAANKMALVQLEQVWSRVWARSS